MTDWTIVLQQISQVTGTAPAPYKVHSLGGAGINQAVRLVIQDKSYFVKLNRAENQPVFEAEAAGVEALTASRTLRTPRIICSGRTGARAYLVLEWIQFGKEEDPVAAGRQLAALHRITHRRYGWERENTIGATPQINQPDDDWVRFWRTQRLGFQLALAAGHGHQGPLQERGTQLMQALPELLDHTPAASLLHGDLWSGNIGYDLRRHPVVYDPAVYYGDRETDLAMTELFGGFPRRFYDAYNEAWPLDKGYATRKEVYNLYHILNHLNLFGGGYNQQALNTINRLLAEIS